MEHIPLTLRIEDMLEKWLTEEEGYTRVATPIILDSEKIKKMNIHEDADLREQIFWLADGKCLRPMLAPNLYEVMRAVSYTHLDVYKRQTYVAGRAKTSRSSGRFGFVKRNVS